MHTHGTKYIYLEQKPRLNITPKAARETTPAYPATNVSDPSSDQIAPPVAIHTDHNPHPGRILIGHPLPSTMRHFRGWVFLFFKQSLHGIIDFGQLL